MFKKRKALDETFANTHKEVKGAWFLTAKLLYSLRIIGIGKCNTRYDAYTNFFELVTLNLSRMLLLSTFAFN